MGAVPVSADHRSLQQHPRASHDEFLARRPRAQRGSSFDLPEERDHQVDDARADPPTAPTAEPLQRQHATHRRLLLLPGAGAHRLPRASHSGLREQRASRPFGIQHSCPPGGGLLRPACAQPRCPAQPSSSRRLLEVPGARGTRAHPMHHQGAPRETKHAPTRIHRGRRPLPAAVRALRGRGAEPEHEAPRGVEQAAGVATRSRGGHVGHGHGHGRPPRKSTVDFARAKSTVDFARAKSTGQSQPRAAGAARREAGPR
mmetsp:Transcript_33283/g.76080  ORF Transcript_33283/g.76080 Transcript_33283/m.76080 type:complete len:258 (-) Transcript_33283:281-1054(-)